MNKLRSAALALIAAIAVLATTACSSSDVWGEVPPNRLSVVITDDDSVQIGEPIFVTDEPSLKILIVVAADSGKRISVVMLTREDSSAAPLNPGGVIELNARDGFKASLTVELPRGTYALKINDTIVPDAIITVTSVQP